MKTRNISIILMAIIGVALLGCATAGLAQQPIAGAWNPADPRQEKPGEAVRERYSTGDSVPGVHAVEVRPNLQNSALQIWYPCDGCTEKVSLLFPSQKALDAWWVRPVPGIDELLRRAKQLPIEKSSVGYGQKWLSF